MLGPMHNAQQQICRKDEKEKNQSAVMASQSPDLYLTEMLGTLETVESTNKCLQSTEAMVYRRAGQNSSITMWETDKVIQKNNYFKLLLLKVPLQTTES